MRHLRPYASLNLIHKLIKLSTKPISLWKSDVENPLKNTLNRHCPKNHSSDFLSEARTDPKNSPEKKPQPDPKTKLTLHVQNYISSMQKF